MTVIFFARLPLAIAVDTSAILRNLRREIRGHGIDVVGQVFPGTGNTGHLRLSAQPSLGAHLARHAGDFAGKRIELIDHGVHGLLEFQDFSGDIDRDLARQIAARHGRRHLRNVSHLRGEVAAHGVDRVGQILPGARHARDQRLTAELAFGTDFARHARHFGGEGAQLVHHGVDGFFELQNLAAHIDGDFLRQVAVGHRDRDIGDIAHLRRQIRRHGVHAFGQLLPNSGHLAHLRLAAKLAVGADFAGDARHLGCEYAELLDHRVDDVRGAQELALQRPAADIERHGLQQVAARDRADGARDGRRRPQQIIDQRIDGTFHVRPCTIG